jgi:hypothetical protein
LLLHQMGVSVDALLPVEDQELLRKAGRYHSQLQLIEYEVGHLFGDVRRQHSSALY